MKKRISYDFIVSLVSLFTAVIPIVAPLIWIEIAKGSGSYGSGSGHDLALLFGIFLAFGLGVFYLIMIGLSLLNDLANNNPKTRKIFAIVITVIDGLAVLTTILLQFLLLL